MMGWPQIAMLIWLGLIEFASCARVIKTHGAESPFIAAFVCLIFTPLPFWFLWMGGFFS